MAAMDGGACGGGGDGLVALLAAARTEEGLPLLQAVVAAGRTQAVGGGWRVVRALSFLMAPTRSSREPLSAGPHKDVTGLHAVIRRTVGRV